MNAPLLELAVTVSYPGRPRVLDDLRLDIGQGEILGLVGASGGGKSTLARSILGLAGRKTVVTGGIRFRDCNLLETSERELRQIRGEQIGLVFQSPASALNPCLRLRTQLREAWRAHRSGTPDFAPVLESVCLPSDDSFLSRFPRSLSVGMAQRFVIAMAILHSPSLLIGDEPTSSLDVITQAGILRLFQRLNRERGIAMLYISHDLPSVASICHRVAILHEGKIVECSAVGELFRYPKHPHTRKLLDSIPSFHFNREPLAAEGLADSAA